MEGWTKMPGDRSGRVCVQTWEDMVKGHLKRLCSHEPVAAAKWVYALKEWLSISSASLCPGNVQVDPSTLRGAYFYFKEGQRVNSGDKDNKAAFVSQKIYHPSQTHSSEDFIILERHNVPS